MRPHKALRHIITVLRSNIPNKYQDTKGSPPRTNPKKINRCDEIKIIIEIFRCSIVQDYIGIEFYDN